MTDDDYASCQQDLADNPLKGALIRNSGGLRKVRFARPGEGKSGGFRVIYNYDSSKSVIRLLFIFAKNEQANLTNEQLKQLKDIIERW